MTENHTNREVLNQEPNSDARLMATLIYVLSFFTTFLAPLIIWLIKREDSAFVDRAGKNYFNFLISYVFLTFYFCKMSDPYGANLACAALTLAFWLKSTLVKAPHG